MKGRQMGETDNMIGVYLISLLTRRQARGIIGLKRFLKRPECAKNIDFFFLSR